MDNLQAYIGDVKYFFGGSSNAHAKRVDSKSKNRKCNFQVKMFNTAIKGTRCLDDSSRATMGFGHKYGHQKMQVTAGQFHGIAPKNKMGSTTDHKNNSETTKRHQITL
jgi:hypothetical protein